jgi:malonyl-CoA/methylmalonyl-CoA synthetase
MLTLIQNALKFPQKTAVIDKNGVFTYKDLLDQSLEVASSLLGSAEDLNQARVAFMVPPSMDYLAVQWGIWRAGGIAVPLLHYFPLSFPSICH